MEKLKYIIEDSTIAELLGVQNFTNKESAMLELVKNAFDAQATELDIIFKNDDLIINDNGNGMNADDIRQHWMHVGKSDKDYEIIDKNNKKRVLAAYLESLGVKQTVSLVASSAFAQISEKVGIDVSVPLRDTVVDSIMSHLRGKSVKEIHTVTNGQFEIVECEVTLNSKANGKYLKEIADPGNSLF